LEICLLEHFNIFQGINKMEEIASEMMSGVQVWYQKLCEMTGFRDMTTQAHIEERLQGGRLQWNLSTLRLADMWISVPIYSYGLSRVALPIILEGLSMERREVENPVGTGFTPSSHR
jgi:hypothetical protein